MTTKILIELKGIKKVFFTDEIETLALNDINLSIREGEFVAISGASGCGKSTLLSLLGLLDVASEGHFSLGASNVIDLNHAERAVIRNRDIGFVFQAFNLIGDMSVFENVELPLTYRNDLSRAERKQRVEAALAKVDMGHRVKHMPAQLSGGQQQRVAIARALVGNPKILLADEPTGNLDSQNAKVVMELLATLNESGTTICMVTHDVVSAEYAPRKVTLFDGQIKSDITVSDKCRTAGVAESEEVISV